MGASSTRAPALVAWCQTGSRCVRESERVSVSVWVCGCVCVWVWVCVGVCAVLCLCVHVLHSQNKVINAPPTASHKGGGRGMGGWVGLQKLITVLDMKNGYKGGV